MRVISTLLCTGLLSLQACASDQPDYEKMYQQRFAEIMGNGGMMQDYQPSETLRGAVNYQPLPLSATPTISVEALQQAEHYAEVNNSTAFMVWQNGELQAERYFRGTSAETLLVSKSLSKPLSAIAIGRAIAMGLIKSVDQPVADFIPEWKGSAKEGVLVRHLLNMHSGFLPQGFSKDPNHPWNKAYLSYEHGKVLINDYPLVDKPGSAYGYNNATADMVALVIEAATGQRFGDFLSEQVLDKIGAKGGTLWVGRPGGLAHSGCCMMLPAETYLRLAILLLNQGKVGDTQVITADYVNDMLQPSPHNPHFGLGIWLGQPYTERRGFTGPDGPGPKIFHSQPYPDDALYLFDGNSNQVVYVLPHYNMVILRLGATPPKTPEWDNSILPDILVKGLN